MSLAPIGLPVLDEGSTTYESLEWEWKESVELVRHMQYPEEEFQATELQAPRIEPLGVSWVTKTVRKSSMDDTPEIHGQLELFRANGKPLRVLVGRNGQICYTSEATVDASELVDKLPEPQLIYVLGFESGRDLEIFCSWSHIHCNLAVNTQPSFNLNFRVQFNHIGSVCNFWRWLENSSCSDGWPLLRVGSKVPTTEMAYAFFAKSRIHFIMHGFYPRIPSILLARNFSLKLPGIASIVFPLFGGSFQTSALKFGNEKSVGLF
ncbi:hypothetical protein C8R43DRAFT_942679 [Mycena crocata]|nr:hypothetical protein C8R43DRAFT_942679 [Mycena crocata]